MTHARWAVAGTIVATAFLAACGGGGQHTASPVVPVASASKAPVNVSVKIRVPAGTTATSTRRAAFISASTQSVTFTLAGASAPLVVIAIATSAPNCMTDPSGLVCTATLPLAPGSQQLTVTAFDGPNGTGTALSTSTTVVSVSPQAANAFSFSLNGIPATASIAFVNASPLATPIPPGTPATVQVAVLAQDADGNTIVGGLPYASSIALANSDTSGIITVSPTSIDAPTTFATISYNGASSLGAVITPMVNNRAGTAFTFAPKGVTLKPVIDIGTHTGNPLALAFGPSGSNTLWFADGLRMGYGDMTSGAVTILANSQFGVVALGPDRLRVWSGESLPPGTIRSSTLGGFTNYPNAAGVGDWTNAAVGSDGAMWFSSLGGGVARLVDDPAAPLVVPVTSGADAPFILAPCGNAIYYSDYFAGAVGRLTLSGGSATDDGEIPLPSPSSPAALFCGSGGIVWEVTGSTLSRIIPATLFANSSHVSWPLPVSLGQQNQVTASQRFVTTPDGAFWAGSLVRISNLPAPASTAAPAMQQYNTNGVGISSLIVASDGTLWYGDGEHIGIVYYGLP